MQLHSNIIRTGKPFVILHGFLGMGDNWKSLGKRFADQGYQVHLLDQRNHGRSFHSESFNYGVLSDDLKKYCDVHQLEDIVLLGHSMGGKTAMRFAVTYPEMISKLIIADISPKEYPLHHQDILKALSSLDFNKIDTRKKADEAISTYIKSHGVRQFLLKNLFWVEKGKLGLRVNLPVLVRHAKEVGMALQENAVFTKQTLFLKGDRSNYIEIHDEFLIKKQFPNFEIITIQNAGHWLHAENPTDFCKEVLNFIN
jgi:pimeloyl-ACP methyl ester carboxylesterase